MFVVLGFVVLGSLSMWVVWIISIAAICILYSIVSSPSPTTISYPHRIPVCPPTSSSTSSYPIDSHPNLPNSYTSITNFSSPSVSMQMVSAYCSMMTIYLYVSVLPITISLVRIFLITLLTVIFSVDGFCVAVIGIFVAVGCFGVVVIVIFGCCCVSPSIATILLSWYRLGMSQSCDHQHGLPLSAQSWRTPAKWTQTYPNAQYRQHNY